LRKNIKALAVKEKIDTVAMSTTETGGKFEVESVFEYDVGKKYLLNWDRKRKSANFLVVNHDREN